jgi:hypothetical protein
MFHRIDYRTAPILFEGWNNGCLSPTAWNRLIGTRCAIADRTLVRKHDDSDFIDRLYNGYHCKVILSGELIATKLASP